MGYVAVTFAKNPSDLSSNPSSFISLFSALAPLSVSFRTAAKNVRVRTKATARPIAERIPNHPKAGTPEKSIDRKPITVVSIARAIAKPVLVIAVLTAESTSLPSLLSSSNLFCSCAAYSIAKPISIGMNPFVTSVIGMPKTGIKP